MKEPGARDMCFGVRPASRVVVREIVTAIANDPARIADVGGKLIDRDERREHVARAPVG